MTQTMQPDDPGAETTVEAPAEREMTYRDLVDRLVDRRTLASSQTQLVPDNLQHLAQSQAPGWPLQDVPPPNWPKVFAPPPVDRDILAENLRRSAEDAVSYGVGITRDGKHIPIDDVFDCSGEAPPRAEKDTTRWPTVPSFDSEMLQKIASGQAQVQAPGLSPETLRQLAAGQLPNEQNYGVTNIQQTPKPSAVPCAPSTSSWFERIEDAGRQQAAQDPSVWDLPDPAIRGAAKMQEAVVEALWKIHAKTSLDQIRAGIEVAIERIWQIDPAKVVE